MTMTGQQMKQDGRESFETAQKEIRKRERGSNKRCSTNTSHKTYNALIICPRTVQIKSKMKRNSELKRGYGAKKRNIQRGKGEGDEPNACCQLLLLSSLLVRLDLLTDNVILAISVCFLRGSSITRSHQSDSHKLTAASQETVIGITFQQMATPPSEKSWQIKPLSQQ